MPAVMVAVFAWVGEEILSASDHIGGDRVVLWMSEN